MAAPPSRAQCFLQDTNSCCREGRRIQWSEWSLIIWAGNSQELQLSGRSCSFSSLPAPGTPCTPLQLHTKAPCENGRFNRTHMHKSSPCGNPAAIKGTMFCSMFWEFCLPGPVTTNFTKPLNFHCHPLPKLLHTGHPDLFQLPTAPSSRDSHKRNGEILKFSWTLPRK